MTAPSLTVALLTPDSFRTLRKTVEHVAAQPEAGEIELLVLAAHPEESRVDEDLAGRFHSTRVVSVDLSAGTGDARAEAVRQAAAPIVVFGEDHCFPQQGWAAALLRAYDGDWAAVGPVVRNANPVTLVSWSDLLKGYGPWLAPGKSGERDHLPGHNSSYRREVLLNFDGDLPALMEAETTLHWKLRGAGYRLFQESGAVVAHTNFDSWGTYLPVTYHAGRMFASTRMLEWPRWRRLAFAAATPLVPAVRWLRHMKQALEAGLPKPLLIRLAPVLAIGLLADGAGQFVGSVAGAGNSRAILAGWDFHRNVPRDRVAAKV